MIDLHMHTKYSDGTDECEEFLKKCEEKKLECIAITDHNTCKAYNKLKSMNIKEYFSGNIICGVELNTKILDIPIEILGYGVDYKKINILTKEIYLTAEERNKLEVKRLYAKCLKEGIKLPNNFIENYDSNIYASKYLHSVITSDEKNKNLIDEESWKNSNIFYRKYMSNPNTAFYVDTDDILPEFEKAASIVKEAGGKVFIPHIFEYRDNANRILDYILKNYKIDGIECYYTTFTKEQSERLLNICKDKNYLISGGSDYHGSFKPNVDIGTGEGDLKVPDNIINNWNIEYWHN